MILYEAEQQQFQTLCSQLCDDAQGQAVLLVDVDGQLVTSVGQRDLDTTSLASLIAATVAATEGLAKLVGEEDYPVHFFEGQRGHLYTVRFTPSLILVVLLDDSKTTLGLVRLRIKGVIPALKKVNEAVLQQAKSGGLDIFGDLDFTDDLLDDFFTA